MANRSYLYSLGNRPTSYADRPDTVSGLSEWAYAVPFSYRVLLSGDPRPCASLIADGFEDDTPEQATALHAISGEFDAGRARLRKFGAVLRAVGGSAELRARLDETEEFLDRHRDRFLLLETVELDSMTEESADGLLACVEREIDACRHAGAAVDALSDDLAVAAAQLEIAARLQAETPFDAFHGLVLDDGFDDGSARPLGVSRWTDVLYFALPDAARH